MINLLEIVFAKKMLKLIKKKLKIVLFEPIYKINEF